MYRMPHKCPICEGKLTVTQLSCPTCGSRLEENFPVAVSASCPRRNPASC